MNCEECKSADGKTPATVPFYAFEAAQYRLDRALQRQQLLTGVMAALAVLPWALRVFGLL